MKNPFKRDAKTLMTIIGQHLERYNILMIVVLAIIIIMDIVFTIFWYYSPDDVPLTTEIAYYTAQGTLFLISGINAVLLVLNRLKKLSAKKLAIAHHIYGLILIVWGTVCFLFDLSLGFSPLVYLFIGTFVAGIFVMDPIFFATSEILSLIPILIVICIPEHRHLLFSGDFFFEDVINLIAFVLLIIVISFRNYRVINSEFKVQKKLHELSYKDELTGLLNERSYVNEVESINNRINSGEDVKFAVVLMDVNNLKATNDMYGHRYGCSLVVRCGHTLPTLFKTSKLFHVGGDEFIVIVYGADYDNFEETMKRFDEAMLYSIVEYEGKSLIFSVARGYSIRQEGQLFKDVLQIADNEMYANKKYLKEKYNMKGR